ncbi:MAG: hypothetical protein IIA45_04150 [Bacteroidetes bacterium]|nr:hypothetical protein [Bacteroidota bacterium]
MKRIKNTLGLFLILFVFAAAFDGCKKGPEDPGLTFKSRTARMVGEWLITNITQNDVDLLDFDTHLSFPAAQPCDSLTIDADVTLLIVYEMEKNGDFTVIEDTSIKVTTKLWGIDVSCVTVVNNLSGHVERPGTWRFAGGVGDSKNKEQVVLIDLYGESEIFDIIRLSAKEMKLQKEFIDFTNATQETLLIELEKQ